MPLLISAWAVRTVVNGASIVQIRRISTSAQGMRVSCRVSALLHSLLFLFILQAAATYSYSDQGVES